MTIPLPPKDLSGGYVQFQYTDGSHTHRHRVHVAAFDASTGTYSTAHGTETTILDTQNNYLSHVKNLYGNQWFWSPLEVWHHTLPADTFELTGFSLAAGVSGAGSPASGQDNYIPRQSTLTLSTGVPNEKLKLIYIAGDQLGYGPTPVIPNPASGSPTAWDALVAYLTGANCAIVAHNNQKARGSGRVTASWNKRLRRRAGDL